VISPGALASWIPEGLASWIPEALASSIPEGLASALFVGVGGAAGALMRFGIGERIEVRRFPASVVVVNVLGTFLATLFLLSTGDRELLLLATVGFCGALTTFSTFSVRTVALWREDRPGAAILFAGGTLAACLAGVGSATALYWIATAIG
jgi:CrcB protein